MDGSRHEDFLRWCQQNGLEPGAAREQLECEASKRSLLRFYGRVFPGYQTPRHVRFWADLLERAERGEVKRIALSAPPGHSKSTILQAFVAWFIGRDPKRRALVFSAGMNLAQRNSRIIRDKIRGDYWPWPEIKLVGESLEEWYVGPGGGGVKSLGQTSAVSGWRAEMVLLDDVQDKAQPEAWKKDAWQWFQGEVETRLQPNGIMVAINTRWEDDDLIGMILENDTAGEWMYVNLPAFAIEGDPLGRAPGEALWPEFWTPEKLGIERSKKPTLFSTVYQGDPVPSGGATFRPEWLEHEYEKLPTSGRISTIQVCDSAWKTGIRNDPTAIVTMVTDYKDIYITDVFSDTVDYPTLKRVLIDQYEKHKPRVLYVERAQSGIAAIDELSRETSIPITGVKPGNQTKEARAEAATGWFETGRVKFPRHKPWMGKVREQFLRFPYGKHDDIVDAVVYGVLKIYDEVARASAVEHMANVYNRMSGWMAR